MLFHLHRASYGKKDTPPDKREYQVREFEEQFGRSPYGSVTEIAEFIQHKLGVSDFELDIYDPVSSPDKNERRGFGRYSKDQQSSR